MRGGFAPPSSGLPGLAACVPADEAVRRDQAGDTLEERAVVVAERGRAVRVDVDLSDDLAFVDDRDDDLAPGRGKAGEIALVSVHVVDDFGLAARGRGTADALSDRDPHVVRRLRAVPWAQH